MPQHILAILNAAAFILNVLLYASTFRFARRENHRIAELTRNVRLRLHQAGLEMLVGRGEHR